MGYGVMVAPCGPILMPGKIWWFLFGTERLSCYQAGPELLLGRSLSLSLGGGGGGGRSLVVPWGPIPHGGHSL